MSERSGSQAVPCGWYPSMGEASEPAWEEAAEVGICGISSTGIATAVCPLSDCSESRVADRFPLLLFSILVRHFATFGASVLCFCDGDLGLGSRPRLREPGVDGRADAGFRNLAQRQLRVTARQPSCGYRRGPR